MQPTWKDGQKSTQNPVKGAHVGLTYQEGWNVLAAKIKVYNADFQCKVFANETPDGPNLEKAVKVV